MEQYVLALDQGTTSSRAIVFNAKGEIVSRSGQEFKQVYPQPGWVEHQPLDIVSSITGVVAEALARARIDASRIAAVGITNQRETTIVWDKATGEPIYNAIVWQCRRTAAYCESVKAQYDSMVYDKTGLTADAYFSATKIRWILDNVEGARARAERGELMAGTVDCYLMWYLSKGKIFKTDYSNASRTMLFNIHTLKWDEELLKLFDIPECILPQVCPSGQYYGDIDAGFFGRAMPVFAAVGDQQAALFGQLCTEFGSVKNTYGTGCFLLMNTADKAIRSNRGLLTSLGASFDKPSYILEGSIFVGGAVVQWLRDEMRMIKSAAETEVYAAKVPDTGGVYLVPAFVGLGAPYWDSFARGTICGITRGTKKEHFIRAALEAVAYQVFDVLHAMERDSGAQIHRLSVDGGASANNFLMQFQADILGAEVARPAVVETTALGAAYIAGISAGFWKDEADVRKNAAALTFFKPQMTDETRMKLLEGWHTAVTRARYK